MGDEKQAVESYGEYEGRQRVRREGDNQLKNSRGPRQLGAAIYYD